jgi:hypothetical protein
MSIKKQFIKNETGLQSYFGRGQITKLRLLVILTIGTQRKGL